MEEAKKTLADDAARLAAREAAAEDFEDLEYCELAVNAMDDSGVAMFGVIPEFATQYWKITTHAGSGTTSRLQQDGAKVDGARSTTHAGSGTTSFLQQASQRIASWADASEEAEANVAGYAGVAAFETTRQLGKEATRYPKKGTKAKKQTTGKVKSTRDAGCSKDDHPARWHSEASSSSQQDGAKVDGARTPTHAGSGTTSLFQQDGAKVDGARNTTHAGSGTTSFFQQAMHRLRSSARASGDPVLIQQASIIEEMFAKQGKSC